MTVSDLTQKLTRMGACLGIALALTGCMDSSGSSVSTSQGVLISSDFQSVPRNGRFAPNLFLSDGVPAKVIGLHYRDGSGGVRATLGFTQDATVRAYSGLTPNTSLTGANPSGSARLVAAYQVLGAKNIRSKTQTNTFTTNNDQGALDVRVNFDTGSLTASNLTGRKVLTVRGQFASGKLQGTATYDGVTGPMTGVVGGGRAVGAFHGADGNAGKVHAGGFITVRP